MRDLHAPAAVLRDEHPDGSNRSGNPHIQNIIDVCISRRRFLGGSVAAAAGFVAGQALAPLSLEAKKKSLLGFLQVPPSTDDAIHVPPGYAATVLAPWGTPLLPGAPDFFEDASNTALHQNLQVGFNHDALHFFPSPPSRGKRGARHGRGLLVVNHEYTDANQIYTAAQGSAITPDAVGREKVAKALAAHGVSVIAIEEVVPGTWEVVFADPLNRRITGTTPMAFSGPVPATHPMLQAAITPAPLGTLNNCGHGVTPWGTYLTCEENWNGYFGTADAGWTPTALESRYGIAKGGFGYNWHVAESRFDLAVNRNELNHFGWVVEIDPFDPTSQAVKRTALGRIKHEGATCTESRGRVVVYTGDDENGDYFYKFVGRRPWRQVRAKGGSPLDVGTLYVAQFDQDGGGRWLPLVHGTGPLTAANGWIDQADVLIRTRMAADAVGATRLHRPEWVAVHPRTDEVFLTLTNGTGNNAAVNSGRDPNPYGHILRFKEHKHDDTTFAWEVFVLGGDPTYAAGAGVPADQAVFGSPDGIWVDSQGIVWIQTDISNSSQNRADRGYDNVGNNAMLAASPETGEVRRFLTGPRGCEITGVTMTPDERTMFIDVQHPGESTTFWNNQFGAPSTANPSTVSSWPFGGRPRPATVVITKLDGGKIGS